MNMQVELQYHSINLQENICEIWLRKNDTILGLSREKLSDSPMVKAIQQ